MLLRCRYLAVFGDYANIEHIRVAFILKTAEPLNSLDFLGRELACGIFDFDGVEERSALQNLGVCIAVIFEPVLQEIAPLASCTDEQKLFSLAYPLNFTVYLAEIYPCCAENFGFGLHIDNSVILCFSRKIFCGRKGFKISAHLVLKHITRLNKRMNCR